MPLTDVTHEQITIAWTAYASALDLVSVVAKDCGKHAAALNGQTFPAPDDAGLTKLEWDLFATDLEFLAKRCVDLARCSALIRELIKNERQAIDSAGSGTVH